MAQEIENQTPLANDRIVPGPSLASVVRERLRLCVITGEIRPGTVLNERGITDSWAVSRTPVREALKELAARGLVEFQPKHGVLVLGFGPIEVEEVLECRLLIELAAIKKATPLADGSFFSQASKILARAKRSAARRTRGTFVLADSELHHQICVLAGNSRFARALDPLQDLTHVMSAPTLADPGRLTEVLEEHEAVIRAMAEGDVPAAQACMHTHLENSKQAILATLNSNKGATDD